MQKLFIIKVKVMMVMFGYHIVLGHLHFLLNLYSHDFPNFNPKNFYMYNISYLILFRILLTKLHDYAEYRTIHQKHRFYKI